MLKKWAKYGLVLFGMSLAWVANSATLPLIPLSWSDLANPVEEGTRLMTHMENIDGKGNMLQADVVSGAFSNVENGVKWYYYLYQIKNTGPDASWHTMSRFTVSPFNGANSSTKVGYFNVPPPVPWPFDVPGTQEPTSADFRSWANPPVGFNFDDGIAQGQISKVLYIKSILPPSTAMGNIIDGTIANGVVVAPVPEPATISLLGLGIATLVLRRKRN